MLPPRKCVMQVRRTHSQIISTLFALFVSTAAAQHQSMAVSMLNSIVHQICLMLFQYSHLYSRQQVCLTTLNHFSTQT